MDITLVEVVFERLEVMPCKTEDIRKHTKVGKCAIQERITNGIVYTCAHACAHIKYIFIKV